MSNKSSPYLILIFTAAWIGLMSIACGGHYDVEVHGQAVVKIDVSQLTSFLTSECQVNNPGATDVQIQQCVDAKVAKFLNMVGV